MGVIYYIKLKNEKECEMEKYFTIEVEVGETERKIYLEKLRNLFFELNCL